MIFEVVNCTMPGMLNPEMTASWEKGLSQVENGELTPGKYRETLESFVTRYVDSVKRNDLSGELRQRFKKIG